MVSDLLVKSPHLWESGDKSAMLVKGIRYVGPEIAVGFPTIAEQERALNPDPESLGHFVEREGLGR